MARLSKGLSTRAVHGGESREKPFHSVTTPIVQTATYVFKNSQERIDYESNPEGREEYGRYGNPTKTVAERKIANLEGGEDAALFSTGMSAFTSTLLAMLSSGTHVIIMDECYRRSRQFCSQVLPRYGIDVSFLKTGDYEQLEQTITKKTRLIISESPTNPYLNVIDLERVANIANVPSIRTLTRCAFAILATRSRSITFR